MKKVWKSQSSNQHLKVTNNSVGKQPVGRWKPTMTSNVMWLASVEKWNENEATWGVSDAWPVKMRNEQVIWSINLNRKVYRNEIYKNVAVAEMCRAAANAAMGAI